MSYGANTYTYNTNGELASKSNASGTTSYTEDVFGNLKSVTLPSGAQMSYLVDGQNRRVGKKLNGTLVNQFVYESQTRVAALLDGSGNLLARFGYATKGNVPDFMITSSGTYRLLSDEVGSVRLVVNASSGQIAEQIDYDEFGQVLADTNPGFQPFGFAGGLYDQDTKLVHFGARDYDPETGRWLSKDPLLFGGGDTNLYGYAVNDPINGIDPSGLDAIVSLYPGANGFGHVGIGVNSSTTSGFYPADGYSPIDLILGQNVPGVERSDLQYTPINSIKIPATPSQDTAIQNFINDRVQNPGSYNLYNNNCATTVHNALGAGGISSPQTIFPRTLFNGLGSGGN